MHDSTLPKEDPFSTFYRGRGWHQQRRECCSEATRTSHKAVRKIVISRLFTVFGWMR